jgi:hypothetical protein
MPLLFPALQLILARMRQAGAFVERYWSVINTPMFDAQHELTYLLHRVEDVTDFVHLQQHERESQAVTAELRVVVST